MMKQLKDKLMSDMKDEPSKPSMSEKEIKMQILKELRDNMDQMMREHGMEDLAEKRDEASGMMTHGPIGPELHKSAVKVEAEDPKDLEEGLDKAKELISQAEIDKEDDEDEDDEDDKY